MPVRESAPPPLTESRYPATHDLDELSVPQLVDWIADQDLQALQAVRAARGEIAHLMTLGVGVLRDGGLRDQQRHRAVLLDDPTGSRRDRDLHRPPRGDGVGLAVHVEDGPGDQGASARCHQGTLGERRVLARQHLRSGGRHGHPGDAVALIPATLVRHTWELT